MHTEPHTPQYTHQILAFTWKGDNLHPQPYPVLRLRRLDTQDQIEVQMEAGFKFNWQLSSQRYCPGYMDYAAGKQQPCPYSNLIADGDMCAYCKKRTGFHAAFFYGDEPNAQMKEILAQTHHIYLAYFQPNTIKVGTAADRKRYIRLIEQDALVGMYIASAPGYHIQKLERAISSELGYTETINSRQKFAFLSQCPNAVVVAPQLYSAYQRIFHHFQGSEFASWFLPSTDLQIIDQTRNSHIYYPPVDNGLHKIDTYNFLSGRFAGLRHKFLLLEKGDRTLVFNKRLLEGRYFTASDEELSYALEQQSQLSLFG